MSETKNMKVESGAEAEENRLKNSPVQDEVDEVDDSAIEPVEDVEIDYEAALESANQEAKENYNRLLRALAEFENYKKRTAREQVEYQKYANEALIKDLLPVVDNLERAVSLAVNESKDVSTFIEGVELTLQGILKIFKKYHVTPIDAVGNPFDPSYHQAVMQLESSDHPVNTIVQELQKGYLIHDRLLRPAMVAVSKSTNTAEESE
jgi:molecular chaperone GrpE